MKKTTAAFIAAFSIVFFARCAAVTAQPSVAFQINPAHTGATVFPNGFELPLQKVWSREWPVPFGEANDVSYPLIANGKVFITVTPFGTAQTGTHVYALSLEDGRTLWRKHFQTSTHWSALAYDNNRLFVATGEGLVSALDPENGSMIWRSRIRNGRNWMFRSPPTAANGHVFLKGSGWEATLFALDQTTGRIVWQQWVRGGGGSGTPTVAGNSVFLGQGARVYRFDAATGRIRWTYSNDFGASAETAPYYSGRLYANNVDEFEMYGFDVKTGTPMNSFRSVWKPPAFANKIGYFITYGPFVAWSTTTQQVLWQQDGPFAIPPLVVNGKVIVVDHAANLYVMNGKSGQILQTLPLGSHITPNSEVTSPMQKGMAAGEGFVVVSTDNMVFALKPAPN
jgi:outer membrane protein assembly factor BamB